MKSKMGWFEMAALAVVGGVGAYGVSRYMNRPLGSQLKIGDVAYVPVDAIIITNAAQAGTINLGAFVTGGAVKVTVDALPSTSTGSGVAGQDFSLRVPVTFNRARVVRVDRAGKSLS